MYMYCECLCTHVTMENEGVISIVQVRELWKSLEDFQSRTAHEVCTVHELL